MYVYLASQQLATANDYMCSSTEEDFVEPPDELKIEDDDIEVNMY